MKEISTRITKIFEHLGTHYKITKTELNFVLIEKWVKPHWWEEGGYTEIFFDHANVLEDFYKFIKDETQPQKK